MKLSSDPRWVVLSGKVHRIDQTSRKTYCGSRFGAHEVALIREDAHRAAKSRGTKVCGKCNAAVERLRGPLPPVQRKPKLDPEKQAIRDHLDEENLRRARLRADEQRIQNPKSTSVRAVSGGLPS